MRCCHFPSLAVAAASAACVVLPGKGALSFQVPPPLGHNNSKNQRPRYPQQRLVRHQGPSIFGKHAWDSASEGSDHASISRRRRSASIRFSMQLGDKARNSAEREDGDSSSRSIHKTGGSATNPQPLLRDEDLLPSLEGRAIDPNFSTSFMAAKGMVGTEARRGAGRGGKVTKTISPVSKGTPATAVRKGSSKVGSNPGPANSASLAAAQMDKLFASLLDTEDDPSPSPVVNALPPLPSPSPPVPAATAATPSTVAAVTPIEEGVFSFAYLEGVKEGADPTSTPLDTSSNLPVAASPEMAGKEKEDKEAAEEGEGEVAAAIAAMKVVDLKEKCREMKLPVGGKKAELQDRILHALGVE